MMATTLAGWHVETFGAGRYCSIAWFARREDADEERARIVMVGAWSGMPPRITPGRLTGWRQAAQA
jgi:hypothetical protein